MQELGSARGCGAYSNVARCCCDSQKLGLGMVMLGRGGGETGGGAEERGGEDGGEGGVGGGSGTARSAARLGQTTGTRGGVGSKAATHPPPQHPPNQRATKPPVPGVSYSVHTAVTVTVQMLQVTTRHQ